MTDEDLVIIEHCSWYDNAYLIDVSVILGINTDIIKFDVMKLVDDGFVTDIEDALFQLRLDALKHLF